MARWNPATGRMEDDNGNPVGTVDIGQMQPAPVAPQQPMTVIPSPVTEQEAADQQAVLNPAAPTAPAGPLEQPATPAVDPTGGMFKNTSRTTTTREVPTKREGALRDAEAASFDKQGALAKKEGALLGQKADAEQKGAETESASLQDTAGQVDKTLAAHGAVVAKAAQQVQVDRDKYNAEVDRLGKVDVSGFYEGDKGRGRMLGNAIAVALGEIGKIFLRSNGPNAATASIRDIEDNYYEAQRARVAKQKDVVSGARDRLGMSQQAQADARQGKQDAINDLALASAARIQAIQAKTKAEAARIGTEHALVEGDRIAAGLETLKTQRLREYEQGIRAKVATETTSVAGSGAAGGAGGGSRAFGRQSDLALFGTEVDQNLQTMARIPLSHAQKIEALKRVQDNEVNLKRIEHDTSLGGALLTNVGRSAGAVPRSRLDGLSDAQKQWIAANDVAEKKTATLLEKSTAPSAQHSALDKISLNSDDTPASMAQKMEERQRIARETIAQSGAVGVTTQKAAGGAGVAPGPTYTGPAKREPGTLPTGKDVEALKWAREHRGDPMAEQILQHLGM